MAEYIERDALLDTVATVAKRLAKSDAQKSLMGRVMYIIDHKPAADVVEVPCRCKDCKHWMGFPNCGCTEFVKVCALAEYMIGQNGYCLYGERKDGK